MKKVLATAFLLGAVPGSAMAQTSAVPSDVSPGALELAHALHDQSITPETLDDAARPLASNLLGAQAAWRGPSCDPAVAACRGAAERIARDLAPQLVAARRKMRDRLLAVIIDGTMEPADIVRSLAFVRTPAGKALAAVMATMDSPTALASLPVHLREKVAEQMMRPPPAFREREVFDRFYDETRDLPRVKNLRVPPPPPAPTPSVSPKRP